MDITNITEKEASGLATLVRITDDAYAVSFKKFDADSGEELTEEVLGGNIKELTERKAELEKELLEVGNFIKKLEALVPQNKEVI
jgi:uncharacterized protein YktB (UPF0637 family)